jgi:hypothetical protein
MNAVESIQKKIMVQLIINVGIPLLLYFVYLICPWSLIAPLPHHGWTLL